MNGIEHTEQDTNPMDLLALSMVIPAYNETARLAEGVARLQQAISAGAIDPETTEFVVVDDGSTDGTWSRATELFGAFPHVSVIRLGENRGKGAAVRAGVAAARAPAIIFCDADMAVDPAQTPEFLRALMTSELAIASRTASGSSADRASIRRSIMSRTFSQLVNTVTRVSLDDTQCGFKAFRAPAAKLLFHCAVIERFAFDVEILVLARRLGLSIAEVPVQWVGVKGSRIRPSIDIGSMVRDVFRARRAGTSAPPLPALLMKVPHELLAPTDPASPFVTLLHALSSQLPVVQQAEGEMLVLCPLMSEAKIDAVARRISDHSSEIVIERIDVKAHRLNALAPLSLTWDDVQRTFAGPAAG